MNIKNVLIFTIFICFSCTTDKTTQPEPKDYPIVPVPFTEVKITDNFWKPRIDTNRQVTLPYDFKKCEETGRINNFAVAGGVVEGEHQGYIFDDSDVFKIMEGAAYCLALEDDPELKKYLDSIINLVALAQEEDGYLYTSRSINPEKHKKAIGENRWENVRYGSHELYNIGHMYEAAVAHHEATGKRTFLDVAIKSADLVCETFGEGKIIDVPGHQEIEIGLAKLYRVTGEQKYLEMAKFFLDNRGKVQLDETKFNINYVVHTQSHKPLLEQDEAIGHAVRAAYMYSGMADVAALTENADYVNTVNKLWENVVSKKLYITGGIGAHYNEEFGKNYELPNLAYNETCASIANVLWNHRMFLLHGDAKYIDVLERTLYNGLIAGISVYGNEFFYPNPLISDGKHKFNKGACVRKGWFGCSCCPSNDVRFIASLPGYIYAVKDDKLYVNLFIGGEGNIKLNKTTVQMIQETDYPWDGNIKITVNPEQESDFSMKIRIPGWAQHQPVPSDLYTYLDVPAEKPVLLVNGSAQDFALKNGYASINRIWKKGDVIELEIPMLVNKVKAHEMVEADKGKIALERGPVVFCLEAHDNVDSVQHVVLPGSSEIKSNFDADLINGVMTLSAKALYQGEEVDMKAIPYYAWAHRGPNPMTVWINYRE